MHTLSLDHCRIVTASNSFYKGGLRAIHVGLQIYQGQFSSLSQATQGYALFGIALSEAFYQFFHPDELGKMVYTAADFSP